jgi:hypothetical protein
MKDPIEGLDSLTIGQEEVDQHRFYAARSLPSLLG